MRHVLTLEWPGPGIEVELSRCSRCEWVWRIVNRDRNVERRASLAAVRALHRLYGQPVVFRRAPANGGEGGPESVEQQIGRLKSELGWEATTGSARKWWDAFEKENVKRRSLVLKLLEELHKRLPLWREVSGGAGSVLTDFFLAYVYSSTDNIQGNLCFFEYRLLKKRDEQRKKATKPPGPAA